MSSRRRNRTTSTTAPQAKVAAPSKPTPQTTKPTASTSSKSATPAPPKHTLPPPAKPTPSTKLRQEWKTFETWLSARRAEKDKRISEKLKEIMSSKGKGRFGRQPASSDSDVGAFEDKLNEELADQARGEWLKRVAATGLREEDWTDITEEEMDVVAAAFIPQERGVHNITPDPPSQVPAQVAPKTTTAIKPPVARNPFAATVEDEPTPPGAWAAPSQSAKRMAGRNGAETPILTRIIPTPAPNGSGMNRPTANDSSPTPESLWEMHLNKQNMSQEPMASEGIWDMYTNKTSTVNSSQASGSRWTPHESTAPAPTSSKLPTPDMLWDMHVNRSSPKRPASPAAPSVFPLSDKLREKLMGKTTEPFSTQPEPEPESLWEAQTTRKNSGNVQRSASTKPVPPASKTPALPKTPVPARTPAPSKTTAPSKLSASMSSDMWDTPATLGHPSLHDMASEPPTPVSSTYAGAYNYISPVFFEMEGEEFPRIDDPVPETVVEDTIRRFYETAAGMEIDLRRNLLSGKFDDDQLEQLLTSHISSIERNARKVLEQWDSAREEAIEERRAEEQRQRMLEEQKQRQAEAKKLAGKKGRKWSLPIVEDVIEEPAAVELPVPSKKKPGKKGAGKNQVNVLEESFSARAATPTFEQDDESTGSPFFQPHPKAPTQAAAAKSMFSFFGKPSQSPAPGTPVPTPWPQTQSAPARPTQAKNPFAPASKGHNLSPDLTPWETFSRKQDPAQLQHQADPWAEDNTDESEEGTSSWTQQAVDTARGGAASAWNIAMSAIGGERPGITALRPPTVATGRENMWSGGDAYSRSEARPVWPEERSATVDPRFTTWRPPKNMEPNGGTGNPAKQMAALAFDNLMDVADDGNDPADLLGAMSMYTKAMENSTRKRGGSNANR